MSIIVNRAGLKIQNKMFLNQFDRMGQKNTNAKNVFYLNGQDYLNFKLCHHV